MKTGVRAFIRRSAVTAGVVVTCASTLLWGDGSAVADSQGTLRADAGCVWRTAAERAQDVQTCTFYSTALGREATVQIRASDNPERQPGRGIYFLDGLGSNPEFSTWTAGSETVAAYDSANTLVFPAGGAGEWMTNWEEAPTGQSVAPQWSTFIGSELPGYLQRYFGVQRSGNGIVGVSMSAGPAIILALDHPAVFKVVRSYSGYYPTDNPLGWLGIPAIQRERADIDNGRTAMWGAPQAPGNRWAQNDVFSRIGEVGRTRQTVIVSSGNGVPTSNELREAEKVLQKRMADDPGSGPKLLQQAATAIALGIALESGAMFSTAALQATTTRLGLPISFDYRNGGHNWYSWSADAKDDARMIEQALVSN
ncbi:mycolyltransferase [Gordonia terrae]|uniref:Mycolyltransferase n=1 Tax=Gordonia terrae TaxID=2055 RepID=A0A2I1R693_9ACTN|nr:alpha/beta hydrolase-fold protein [Gordonia terrae]PKZ64661.1 mycolyltransferase [Gordonia terrae]